MADHKKKKRIMTKFRMTEISAVDRPAQSPALAVIMKRVEDNKIEKRTVLASMEVLHTHAVVIDDYAKINKGGSTSWAGTTAEDQHSHDFVINEDGTITIGANEGHLHLVDKNVEEITKNGLTDEQLTNLGLVVEFQKGKSTATNGGQQSGSEDEIMMTDTEKAAMQKAQDDLDSVKKSLAIAVALGALNDGQTAIYKSLKDEAAEEFLAKSNEDREAIVTVAKQAAADKNAVVYKSNAGIEFRKSDDPRLVAMAKDGDIMAAKLAKSDQRSADLEISKRATELFKNLSGEGTTHEALLKAVDGIEDETVRKAVMETLGKQDAGISVLLKEHGTSIVAKVTTGDADAELEVLTKAYVAEHPEVNYFDAYGIVAEANAELYSKAVG